MNYLDLKMNYIELNMIINKKVLLLNSSYEPLLVVSVKKAILLFFTNKIEIVENSDFVVRSSFISFKVPSIVKLKKYVFIKNRSVALNRKNVLKRDNYTCQYCKSKNIELTLDHIIPKDKGGNDSWSNLVAACRKCNMKKGNKLLKEVRMKLIKLPKKPSYLLNLHNYSKKYESWKPYLYLKNKGI